jgi:hypothetical protein
MTSKSLLLAKVVGFLLLPAYDRSEFFTERGQTYEH